MPQGEWYGWYFSEELKFAADNGYKITIVKGYHFNKVFNLFDDYVKDFYNIKSNSSDNVEKAIAKSLLNNLLGRFGIRLDEGVSDIVSLDTFNKLALMKKVNSYK